MPTPIAFQKIQTETELITIPIFSLSEITDNSCRVQLESEVGCYDLMEPSEETPLRVSTSDGIKGINLFISSVEASLVDYNAGISSNNTVVTTVHKDSVYTQLITPSNGHGFFFPISSLEVDVVYTASANVEMLQAVDDRITLHIWNVTKGKYIKTGVATSSFSLNQVQLLSGTFTPTSTTYTPGDQIQLQIVQSWRNSTHDNPFEFKIFNDGLEII